MSITTAVYAFSGDPITFGHLDIIRRAAQLFDQLIVGIGINPEKDYLFSLEERTQLARQSLQQLPNVQVKSFTGLLVDFAFEHHAQVIVKGVRNPTDFEYENNLCRMSDSQDLGIDTIFFIAKPELAHVSSSAVKQLQKEQGLIDQYVPLNVKQALEAKMSGQYLVGLTGEIGAGKSYVAKQFIKLGQKQGLKVHNIELDQLVHQIYQELDQPGYQALRKRLAQTFGQQIQNQDGTISRQKLGQIVFASQPKLEQLNQILHQPLMVRLRKSLYQKQGLILLNAALIAEAQMTALVNNHVCLVKTDQQTQLERLKERDLGKKQIDRRLASQYSYAQKKELLEAKVKQSGFGQIWEIDNAGVQANQEIFKQFEKIIDYFALDENH